MMPPAMSRRPLCTGRGTAFVVIVVAVLLLLRLATLGEWSLPSSAPGGTGTVDAAPSGNKGTRQTDPSVARTAPLQTVGLRGRRCGHSWDAPGGDTATLPPLMQPDVVMPVDVGATPARGWVDEPLADIQTVELRGGYRLVLRVGPNHTVHVGGSGAAAAHRRRAQSRWYVTDDACVFHPRLTPLRFAKCVRPSLVTQKWLLHSFPPVVYNPLPCVQRDAVETNAEPYGSGVGPTAVDATTRADALEPQPSPSPSPVQVVDDAGEVACGCFAPVAPVQNVFLFTQESPKHPLVPRMLALTNETRRGLMVVDRTSTLLNINRCFSNWGDHPRLNGAYHRVVDLVARKRVDVLRRATDDRFPGVGAVVDEAFYATDNVLHLPGHALDAVLEGLAQYYDAGLHRRRVPWLVAHVAQRRNFFHEILLEVLDILAVGTRSTEGDAPAAHNGGQRVHELVVLYPTMNDPKQALPFVRHVWFANARHGFYSPVCYTPFLANVLYPAAMVALRQRGLLPPVASRPSSIAMLKLRGAGNVASAYRSLQLTDGFARLCEAEGVALLNQTATIAEKLFYLNTAELLITNYGGTASFASLLRLPRGGRVLMLVMGGSYTAEFEAFVGHRVYVGFAVTMPVVAAQTKHAGGFPFFGLGLRTRYLVVQSLDDVTAEDFVF